MTAFSFTLRCTLVSLAVVCYSIAGFSQQKSGQATWPGNANTNKQLSQALPTVIPEDLWKRGAVSAQEMSRRAETHPYMTDELVIAVEFQLSKRAVRPAIGLQNWKEITGADCNVLRTLMVKEQAPGISVALVLLKLPAGLMVFDAMNIFNAKSAILWSSPNFYYPGDPRDVVPNDPQYGAQYHHDLMDNDLAWNTTYGSAAVTIGITDDGVDRVHSDLAPNIWVNPGEIAGNGIDDDANGYIDDVNGWDFSNGNNNPSPDGGDSHGTHVAGISAARTNNGIGVAGVGGHCTIVPLQFYGGANPWTAALINETYSYAADNGVKVLSTSYNVDGFVGDPVFQAALDYMYSAGVLHFNSAGNNSELNPPRQIYTHSLYVASTQQNDGKSSFSNYGTGIDISAPGSDILSTIPGNAYDEFSGTSMATPNAAGAAGLIWSAFPAWTREQVAAALLANADNIDAVNPGLNGLLGTGRVNTFRAITVAIPAPQIKTLTGLPAEGGFASASDIGSVTIQFDQLLDPVSANTILNYRFFSAGANGIFGDGDDVVIPVTTNEVYRVGTNQQTFRLDNAPLPCGNYRFVLVSGGLRNPFNTPLDGNSDGTGGDNYVRNFSVAGAYYADNDGDGYGSGAAVGLCPPGPGFVLLNGDCDDSNNAINPGAAEICNNIDDNCDGVVDIWDLPLGIAQTFSNSTALTIPGSGTGSTTGSAASVYPSNITVSGFNGPLGKVRVRLNEFSHTWPSDVDVLLVGPNGQKFKLLSDVGGGDDVLGATLVFDDAAANSVPAPILFGTYRPTDNDNADNFPAPAPAGPYESPAPAGSATFSSTFSGSPNGIWSLYIVDDTGTDAGSMSGWDLTLTPLTDICELVPLTLLSFEAVDQTDITATLEWKTLAEYNTHSFTIEESTDGIRYEAVGNVGAAGSGNHIYRQKMDLRAPVMYYRLKMIDRDQRIVYSNIVVVKRKPGTVRIAENPVKEFLTVISSDHRKLGLFNNSGQLLRTFTTKAMSEKIEVRGLASGMYYLRGEGVQLKFIISR